MSHMLCAVVLVIMYFRLPVFAMGMRPSRATIKLNSELAPLISSQSKFVDFVPNELLHVVYRRSNVTIYHQLCKRLIFTCMQIRFRTIVTRHLLNFCTATATGSVAVLGQLFQDIDFMLLMQMFFQCFSTLLAWLVLTYVLVAVLTVRNM